MDISFNGLEISLNQLPPSARLFARALLDASSESVSGIATNTNSSPLDKRANDSEVTARRLNKTERIWANANPNEYEDK